MPTGISWLSKPTKEKTKTSSGAADMLKFPSKSVCVPFEVPLIKTFAPGNGIFEPSSTVPVSSVDCAQLKLTLNKSITKK